MNALKNKVAQSFSNIKGKKLITVEGINHKNGSALILFTFTTKSGNEKTIGKKIYLNPETYPEALRVEGQTQVF